MASVFLIGFMGAGKSTVGAKLAANLGWTFCDLDQEIERRTRQTISEIFERQGEAEFRRLECETLRDLMAGHKTGTIFALGGGAIENPELWQLIAGHPIVYLEGDFDFLVRRCAQEGDTRPVLRDLEQARQRYLRRQPLYRRASFTVRVHEGEHCHSPQELAEEVRNRLRHVCLNAG